MVFIALRSTNFLCLLFILFFNQRVYHHIPISVVPELRKWRLEGGVKSSTVNFSYIEEYLIKILFQGHRKIKESGEMSSK